MRRRRSNLSPRTTAHTIAIFCVLWVCSASICCTANAESKNHPAAATLPERNATWAVLMDKNINLYRVSPTFYRSAQFNHSQVGELESLGIRTSVDLRKFHSDSHDLNGSSIKQVHVGTNTWSISDKTVIAALIAIRRAEATGPVVLHCQHGADRTGLITAMYRIVYQGWTKDDALDELLNGGYGYHSVWKNIPGYLKHVDIDKLKDAVNKELVKFEGN